MDSIVRLSEKVYATTVNNRHSPSPRALARGLFYHKILWKTPS